MTTSGGPPKVQFGPPLRLGNNDDALAYYVFNPEGTESVMFLHGAMTGGPEWDTVLPHFSNQYHLIVPDIPLHNNSKDVKLQNAAIDTGDLLCQLIRSEAKQGRAHVVVLSLGAHVGRRLAVQCPEVVKTCFLSGYARLESDWMPLKTIVPYVVFAVEYVGSKIPKEWVDGIEHTADTSTPRTLEHLKRVWALLGTEGVKDVPWSARTLLVAASKGGLIPTNDSIKDARELASVGKKGNSETRAVQNKKMRHAWNRQDPRAFADAVMCWIEDRPLPDDFEPV